MDIQKMVDDRLEELLARQPRAPRIFSAEDDFDVKPRHTRVIPVQDDFAAAPRNTRARKRRRDVMDLTLAEIAERILAVTEQLAGDYTRMEKDILDSRLTVLQSAEAVLDIAISLKRKAQILIDGEMIERTERRRYIADVAEVPEGVEDIDMQDGRVSMHDLGVASLFRRT